MGGKKSRCLQSSKIWRQFSVGFICRTLSGQLCLSIKFGYSLIQPLSVTVTNFLFSFFLHILRTRNNIRKTLLAYSSLHSPFYIPFFDMGVTKKQGGKESEGNIWSIAGIPVRVPLKSTSTKPKEGYEDYEDCCSTPSAREFKMPEMFTCPEAPRKRRPSLNCDGYDKCVMTPPAREFKMPEMFTCPAAPRKRRPSLNCEDHDKCCTTPPAREFKMPEMFTCPAAPRKRRPSLNCEDYDKCVVTPPAREFKILEMFTCPAAPRKLRPSLNCHFYGVGFSNSPDLESVCLYSPC